MSSHNARLDALLNGYVALPPQAGQLPVFDAVFIADTHLGGGTPSQSRALLEFLHWIGGHHDGQVKTRKIYGAGDLRDGWRIMSLNRPQEDEMDRRCIDAALSAAHRGVELRIIPGNHDENLRHSRFEKTRHFRVEPGAALPATDITLKGPAGEPAVAISLRQKDTYTDAAGRQFLVVHGDEFDRFHFKSPWQKWLSRTISDPAFDLLVNANAGIISASQHYFHTNFSPFDKVRRLVGPHVPLVRAFEERAADSIRDTEFDGIICGHIHVAAEREIKGKTYLNTGDFMEGACALAFDHAGNCYHIHWGDIRKSLGFDAFPQITDPNPCADFRPLTERLLRLEQGIFRPAYRRAALARIREGLDEIEQIRTTGAQAQESGEMVRPPDMGEDVIQARLCEIKTQRARLRKAFRL